MIQSSSVYKNTKNINNDTGLLDVCMECAYFLEEIGALAFKNWSKGEIVSGPYVDRFFSTISIMYHVDALPDNTVLERLRRMNCKISYRNDNFKRVVTYKEENEEIYRQKAVENKVWILTLKIPNRYLALDGNTTFNIDGEDVNYEDIEALYDNETKESLNSNDDGDPDNEFNMNNDDLNL